MNNLINIAIDGHSCCGKSTIAKAISKRFSMRYLDTGAMYRAVTLYCMQNNIINNKLVDLGLLNNHLNDIQVRFLYNSKLDISQTFLNGTDVEDIIRGTKVSENVSQISKIKIVRNKLINLQKEIGQKKNVVMDGRDIGTNILPEAEIKFFITASDQIRAKRRHKQLVYESDCIIDFDSVLHSLRERDISDTKRKINPLTKSSEAILIDNSNLSLLVQNQHVFNIIEKYFKNQ